MLVLSGNGHQQEVGFSKYYEARYDAKLVWEYEHPKKKEDQNSLSLQWDFYSKNGSRTEIATAHANSNWEFKLSSTCPKRLQNPTRVSKANPATFFIFIVTRADGGQYGCTIRMKNLTTTTLVRLVVTAHPQFTIRPPLVMYINEGQDLYIQCEAQGPPVPMVTWYQNLGAARMLKSQGLGKSPLSIPKIKRDQNGTFECQVNNNPNEMPVTAKTNVIVNWYQRQYIAAESSKSTVIGLAVIVVLLVLAVAVLVAYICLKRQKEVKILQRKQDTRKESSNGNVIVDSLSSSQEGFPQNTDFENGSATRIPNQGPTSAVQEGTYEETDTYDYVAGATMSQCRENANPVHTNNPRTVPVARTSPEQSDRHPEYSNSLELFPVTPRQVESTDLQSRDLDIYQDLLKNNSFPLYQSLNSGEPSDGAAPGDVSITV